MKIPEDYERFAKVSSGVQSIAVTLAVVIGGGWTLYSFSAARTAERATLEMELARATRPAVELAITANAILSTDPSDKYQCFHKFIQASVTVKNTGNMKVDIDLSEPTVYISEVNVVGNDLVADENIARKTHLSTLPFTTISLLPGNSTQIPYLTKVQASGLYFVQFRMTWPSESKAVLGPARSDMNGALAHYALGSVFVDVPPIQRDMKNITSRVICRAR